MYVNTTLKHRIRHLLIVTRINYKLKALSKDHTSASSSSGHIRPATEHKQTLQQNYPRIHRYWCILSRFLSHSCLVFTGTYTSSCRVLKRMFCFNEFSQKFNFCFLLKIHKIRYKINKTCISPFAKVFGKNWKFVNSVQIPSCILLVLPPLNIYSLATVSICVSHRFISRSLSIYHYVHNHANRTKNKREFVIAP